MTAPSRRARKRFRDENLPRIPWVAAVSHEQVEYCDGLKYSKISARDVYPWGPGGQNPPRGLREDRHACRNFARWRYDSLRPRRVLNGFTTRRFLCTTHLFSSGLYGSMEEETRLLKWMRRHAPDLLRAYEEPPS